MLQHFIHALELTIQATHLFRARTATATTATKTATKTFFSRVRNNLLSKCYKLETKLTNQTNKDTRTK